MAANFFQPGFDEQTESQNIERQRQYAQLLRQQSEQSPQASMVSGHYVAPSITQGLAQLLKAYQGGKGMREADSRQKALAEAVRGRTTQEMGEFTKRLAGTPAQATGQTYQTGANEMGDEAATVPQWQGAQGPDMKSAYAFAANAQTPALQQVGLRGLAEMPQIEARAADRQEDRAFRTAEREAVAAQRMAEMQQNHALRMQQMAEQNASRQQMAEENRAFQMEMRKLQASFAQSSAQPYFTPIPTADGIVAFNNRTGQAGTTTVDGKPVLPAAVDPRLQGNIAGAKAAATSNVEQGVERTKANKRSDQMLTAIDQAEALLKQGPTQSGIGSAADAAARVVGVSTPGAQTAGQLETLSGWLVANVPRMEGPQSNIDVQNYTTMAGMVGDRTRPIAERQAALKTVRELQQKYKQFNQEPTPAGTQPASGAQPAPRTIRYDAQGNRLP